MYSLNWEEFEKRRSWSVYESIKLKKTRPTPPARPSNILKRTPEEETYRRSCCAYERGPLPEQMKESDSDTEENGCEKQRRGGVPAATFVVRKTLSRGTPAATAPRMPEPTARWFRYIVAVSMCRPPSRRKASTAAAAPGCSSSKRGPATPSPTGGGMQERGSATHATAATHASMRHENF